MTTTHFQPMAFQHQQNNSQCIDTAGDLDQWVDFGASPMTGSSSKGKMPMVSISSAITSPTSTAIPLDSEDQIPVAPSHDYGRFKQQTGLPTGALSSLTPINEFGYNSGIDTYNFGAFDGMGSQNGFGSMSGDMGMDSQLPAFFFPNDSQNDDFIDPTAIEKQEEAQANMRYYPGMHQQAAALRAQQAAQAQRQQMMAAQQKQSESSHRRKASPVDAHAEETIQRVVNQIRQNSMMHASMSPENSSLLPHTIKKMRDEDDMDEDERLLNSEEGKKLSSKERRQLRNKVSARAFRSRRKEYIGQLEGEVAMKVNEAAELKIQNRALMEENARFRNLAEKLLAHAAFRPFLEELSRDPEIANSFASVVSGSVPSSAPQAPAPQPQIKKDPNPYEFNGQQQFPNQVQHVGMTLVPETHIDFSQLNIGGNNWNAGSMGFAQPQVFAVLDLPEEPVDVAVLSGKTEEVEPVFDTCKYDAPVEIETTAVAAESKDTPIVSESVTVAEEASTCDIDEHDPQFGLFANSPTATATPTFEDAVSLLSQLPSSKPSHFELISESDVEGMPTAFDKNCARLDAACRRLDSLFASFGL